MTTEDTYTRRDMDAAYHSGRRAAGTSGFAYYLAIGAIVIMVGIMIATYIGFHPFQSGQASAPIAAPQAQPAPRVAPQAPVAQPQPIVVQNVPAGQAPQPIVQPAPAPQPVDAPAEPVNKPIVIVLHKGYQQPVVTGSGACQVAKGARRCGDK